MLGEGTGAKYFHKLTNQTTAWIQIIPASGSFQGGDKFFATLYNGNASTDGFVFKSPAETAGAPAEGQHYMTVTYSKTDETVLEYELTDDDINDDGSVTVYRYNSNCYVRHIEIQRAAGSEKTEGTASFANSVVGFKVGEAAGQSVTTNSDGAVTYTSANTAVVTVDAATGALTAVAPGKTTITAKVASSSTFTACSASYVVYVLSNADGTLENAYLPTDFRYLAETAEEESAEKAWVVGFIVGTFNSASGEIKIGSTGAEATLGLGNTAEEDVPVNCLVCQLISETAPRTDLNLKGHTDYLKKKVWLYGTIGKYVTSSVEVYGLHHAEKYSWDGATVVPEEDTTGISNISRNASTANQYYNLAGQRVAQPTKGLYIVDGKKVVIK